MFPRRARRAVAPWLLACWWYVSPCAAAVLLNEVLYDPPGADGGHEFVELLNAGAQPLALTGYTLEFANGSVGPVWSVRWRGDAADVLPPGGRWLIVDQGWSGDPPADAVVSLGLQNGPDAVRLRRGDETIDLLGYGDLTDPELFEGTPHPGAPGAALARRPDGCDTDRNDRDWFGVDEPTPGTPNVRAVSAAVEAWTIEPPWQPAPLEPFRLDLALRNDGFERWPALTVEVRDVTGGVLAAGEAPEGIEPDGGAAMALTWPAWSEGRRTLALAIPLPDGAETLTTNLGTFQVGAGPCRFTELMPAPERDAPEWFALAATAGAAAAELEGWTVEDASGSVVRCPPFRLEEGSEVVWTPDAEAFTGWTDRMRRDGVAWPCPDLDPLWYLLEPLGGWASLNNGSVSGEPWADRLILRDPAGVAVDAAAWGGDHPEALTGRSLERLSEATVAAGRPSWSPCTAAAGATPGCRNSLDGGTDRDGRLRADPPSIADGGTVLRFALAPEDASWSLDVIDLDGRLVRALGGDAFGPGPREVGWDGSDDAGEPVPAGPCLVVLRRLAEDGRVRGRDLCLVVRRRSGS